MNDTLVLPRRGSACIPVQGGSVFVCCPGEVVGAAFAMTGDICRQGCEPDAMERFAAERVAELRDPLIYERRRCRRSAGWSAGQGHESCWSSTVGWSRSGGWACRHAGVAGLR
jgi:hypothetical protein